MGIAAAGRPPPSKIEPDSKKQKMEGPVEVPAAEAPPAKVGEAADEEKVPVRFVHGKTTHTLDLGPADTVGLAKQQLEALTNVPAQNQKLMYKGKKEMKDNEA